MWTASSSLSSSSLLAPATLPLPPRTANSDLARRMRITMSLPPPTPTDALTSLGRLLWGRSLPPQLLISTVRSAWSAAWQLMMRQLAPASSSGSYSRPPGPFPSVPSHYYHSRPSTSNLHLYAALPCPWAHRSLIVRALLDLESSLPVSLAAPGPDGPWEFPSDGIDGRDLAPSPDRANGRRTLREVYGMRKGGYDGRATVPMLWDVERREVVCNESYEIIKFLNSGFRRREEEEEEDGGLDLYPKELEQEIEEWNRIIYPNVNNGVYRCGFAQSQEAYNVAVNDLFTTLDKIESHLSSSRYLCGDALTIADVCLFTTMIRFDLVYNVLFKCTKKKLLEYPNLQGYTRDIYQIPKVAATCNFEAYIDGYYGTLFPLNPGGIRPIVPSVCEHEFLSQPHNRESLSLKAKQHYHHVP